VLGLILEVLLGIPIESNCRHTTKDNRYNRVLPYKSMAQSMRRGKMSDEEMPSLNIKPDNSTENAIAQSYA